MMMMMIYVDVSLVSFRVAPGWFETHTLDLSDTVFIFWNRKAVLGSHIHISTNFLELYRIVCIIQHRFLAVFSETT